MSPTTAVSSRRRPRRLASARTRPDTIAENPTAGASHQQCPAARERLPARTIRERGFSRVTDLLKAMTRGRSSDGLAVRPTGRCRNARPIQRGTGHGREPAQEQQLDQAVAGDGHAPDQQPVLGTPENPTVDRAHRDEDVEGGLLQHDEANAVVAASRPTGWSPRYREKEQPQGTVGDMGTPVRRPATTCTRRPATRSSPRMEDREPEP
jgi:hypothetical protein